MRKSRYSDEQIAAAMRQAELGTPVAEITRKLGISEATFYVGYLESEEHPPVFYSAIRFRLISMSKHTEL
jgi:putative transposase